jgi:hypothetical protein
MSNKPNKTQKTATTFRQSSRPSAKGEPEHQTKTGALVPWGGDCRDAVKTQTRQLNPKLN